MSQDYRFKNLPYLLGDMERKGWIIDSFPFRYNGVSTYVILKRYKENERKPTPYAKAKLEFVDANDFNHSIHAYADFYNVSFGSVDEFVRFFNIHNRSLGRDLFLDFSEYFAQFIPKSKIINKNDPNERRLLGSRAEANMPDHLYCFDVRRNGKNGDGTLHERSTENSNKAEILRPSLYKKFKDDKNLSFYFSDDPMDELPDADIIKNFAKR